jgi:hypothetical protein
MRTPLEAIKEFCKTTCKNREDCNPYCEFWAFKEGARAPRKRDLAKFCMSCPGRSPMAPDCKKGSCPLNGFSISKNGAELLREHSRRMP